MAIRILSTKITLVGLLLAAPACSSLQNVADVIMPAYNSELVVECYLESGATPRLTVVESGEFLPPIPSQPTVTLPTGATPTIGLSLPNGGTLQLPVDATVSLRLPGGQVLPLRFAPGIDPVTRKYFTHTGTAPLVLQAGQRLALEVRDTRGRRVTGTATVPTFIPIDSVRHGFNGLSGPDRQANFVTRWSDPVATVDYYRLLLSNQRRNNDLWADYMVTDQLFNGQPYTALTTYRFAPGDTMTATLYHIEPAYYSFQQSVREAMRANNNPFAQPARIRSTVQGGIGIFTVLVPDRRTRILR